MATVSGVETKTRNISINIDKTQALKALAKELNVYCYFKRDRDQSYKIEDGKIFMFEDISYHGSPIYEKTLVSCDELLVNNYKMIKELATLNEINLVHWN